MSFAIIETGGKQYKVSKGDVISIEKMNDKEYKEGDSVSFSNVLLLEDEKDLKIGTPFLEGSKVDGIVKEIGRHKKIDVVHYKSKINYFKRQGHRQPYFKVEISALK